MLIAAAGLRWLAPAYISEELGHRLFGILLGLFAAYYANAVPKLLKPLPRLRDPAREQALRRFTGWTLVIGAVAYVVAWIVVPIAQANTVAMSLLGTTFLIVLARHLWVWLGRNRS
jgi:fructose-specific phosphotransferase system IIC component